MAHATLVFDLTAASRRVSLRLGTLGLRLLLLLWCSSLTISFREGVSQRVACSWVDQIGTSMPSGVVWVLLAEVSRSLVTKAVWSDSSLVRVVRVPVHAGPRMTVSTTVPVSPGVLLIVDGVLIDSILVHHAVVWIHHGVIIHVLVIIFVIAKGFPRGSKWSL